MAHRVASSAFEWLRYRARKGRSRARYLYCKKKGFRGRGRMLSSAYPGASMSRPGVVTGTIADDASTPALPAEAPPAGPFGSSRRTLRTPRRRSHTAAETPTMPAPTTATLSALDPERIAPGPAIGVPLLPPSLAIILMAMAASSS